MKIKDTKLVLKVRSFKAGKYIQLLLSDSLEDFQKTVAPVVPRIISTLRKNNGYETKKHLEKYIYALESQLSIANQILGLIEKNVIPHMQTEEDESGKTITVDGNINYSIQPGDSVDLASGKTTKKKAKKEE